MASTDCIDVVAVLKEECRELRGRTGNGVDPVDPRGVESDQTFVAELAGLVDLFARGIEPTVGSMPGAKAAVADLKATAGEVSSDIAADPDGEGRAARAAT